MLSLSASCMAGSEKLELKQQRFFLSSEPSQTGADELWQIPVCTRTSAGANGSCTLMTQAQQTESALACSDWTFGNRDAKGYYRVAYAPDDLKQLASIAERQLNVPERIALVEDTWAMTRADKTSVADFLTVSQQLRAEQNQRVVDSLASHLEYIGQSLGAETPERSARYQAFIREQFSGLAKQIGWNPGPSDTDEQKTLRASLLEILGSANDPEAVALARKLVQQYAQNPGSVDGTLIGPAFSVAAENGDVALYDRFTEALNSSKSTDEYYHYLYALVGFRQPQLVERTLGLLDAHKVRQQDYPRLWSVALKPRCSQWRMGVFEGSLDRSGPKGNFVWRKRCRFRFGKRMFRRNARGCEAILCHSSRARRAARRSTESGANQQLCGVQASAAIEYAPVAGNAVTGQIPGSIITDSAVRCRYSLFPKCVTDINPVACDVTRSELHVVADVVVVEFRSYVHRMCNVHAESRAQMHKEVFAANEIVALAGLLIDADAAALIETGAQPADATHGSKANM